MCRSSSGRNQLTAVEESCGRQPSGLGGLAPTRGHISGNKQSPSDSGIRHIAWHKYHTETNLHMTVDSVSIRSPLHAPLPTQVQWGRSHVQQRVRHVRPSACSARLEDVCRHCRSRDARSLRPGADDEQQERTVAKRLAVFRPIQSKHAGIGDEPADPIDQARDRAPDGAAGRLDPAASRGEPACRAEKPRPVGQERIGLRGRGELLWSRYRDGERRKIRSGTADGGSPIAAVRHALARHKLGQRTLCHGPGQRSRSVRARTHCRCFFFRGRSVANDGTGSRQSQNGRCAIALTGPLTNPGETPRVTRARPRRFPADSAWSLHLLAHPGRDGTPPGSPRVRR